MIWTLLQQQSVVKHLLRAPFVIEPVNISIRVSIYHWRTMIQECLPSLLKTNYYKGKEKKWIKFLLQFLIFQQIDRSLRKYTFLYGIN